MLVAWFFQFEWIYFLIHLRNYSQLKLHNIPKEFLWIISMQILVGFTLFDCNNRMSWETAFLRKNGVKQHDNIFVKHKLYPEAYFNNDKQCHTLSLHLILIKKK